MSNRAPPRRSRLPKQKTRPLGRASRKPPRVHPSSAACLIDSIANQHDNGVTPGSFPQGAKKKGRSASDRPLASSTRTTYADITETIS